LFGIFPSRVVWRRPGLQPVELLVFAALLALLFGLLRLDGLLPLVDAAVMLGLAQVHDAKLETTEPGREFAAADIDASKTLFGELVLESGQEKART
jgi:C-terminal AAA-associated domain